MKVFAGAIKHNGKEKYRQIRVEYNGKIIYEKYFHPNEYQEKDAVYIALVKVATKINENSQNVRIENFKKNFIKEFDGKWGTDDFGYEDYGCEDGDCCGMCGGWKAGWGKRKVSHEN